MNTTDPLKTFAAAPTVPAATPQEQPFLTVGAVARLASRSSTTIKHLAAELRLPDIRAGHIRLFPPDQVQKLKNEVERRERDALR